MSEDVTEAVCQVKITGPGIQAEKEVTLPIAMAVLQVMFGGAYEVAAASPGTRTGHQGGSFGGPQPERMQQRLSLREFTEEAGGKSFPEKIVAIARYMRDHEGQQDFSRDDIKVRFRSAGEAMPGNFPRDFQKALQSGWIAEDPQNRGRFYVTRRGDDAIDQKFDGVSAVKVRTRRRRRANASDPATSGDDE